MVVWDCLKGKMVVQVHNLSPGVRTTVSDRRRSLQSTVDILRRLQPSSFKQIYFDSQPSFQLYTQKLFQ